MKGTTRRDAFRAAVEAHDVDGMVACFAEDAELHSPITFKPFQGRTAIAQVFSFLFEVFEDFRYTDALEAADGTSALIFRARVGERELQGLDLFRFTPSGEIANLTVMVRPRSGMEALLGEMGPRLAAASGAGAA